MVNSGWGGLRHDYVNYNAAFPRQSCHRLGVRVGVTLMDLGMLPG